jgi:hypothetical protein
MKITLGNPMAGILSLLIVLSIPLMIAGGHVIGLKIYWENLDVVLSVTLIALLFLKWDLEM